MNDIQQAVEDAIEECPRTTMRKFGGMDVFKSDEDCKELFVEARVMMRGNPTVSEIVNFSREIAVALLEATDDEIIHLALFADDMAGRLTLTPENRNYSVSELRGRCAQQIRID